MITGEEKRPEGINTQLYPSPECSACIIFRKQWNVQQGKPGYVLFTFINNKPELDQDHTCIRASSKENGSQGYCRVFISISIQLPNRAWALLIQTVPSNTWMPPFKAFYSKYDFHLPLLFFLISISPGEGVCEDLVPKVRRAGTDQSCLRWAQNGERNLPVFPVGMLKWNWNDNKSSPLAQFLPCFY